MCVPEWIVPRGGVEHVVELCPGLETVYGQKPTFLEHGLG